MKTRISLAALLAAGVVAAAAHADFADGNFVGVSGSAFTPGGISTTWGTNSNQGPHQLGTQTTFFDAVFGPTYPVFVHSTVVDPHSVIFHIDFSAFFPGDFTFHSIDITGLKSDGTIIDVAGNSGGFSTNGNDVHWEGTGAELVGLGSLDFKVFQSPGPGALGLLGVAGLAGSRRRRA